MSAGVRPSDRAGAPTVPPGFAFRELAATDLEALIAIERRLFQTPWDEAAFRAFLGGGLAFSQVAVARPGHAGNDASGHRGAVEGVVAGYALGWCVGREAELANLAVDTLWQRRSLGSALLAWTLATCARRGAADLFLEVRASNLAAQRLYRAHGFELHARRRGYYANPREDALVMRARLTRSRPAGNPD